MSELALVVSIAAFVFALAVWVAIATSYMRCFRCGRYRREDEDGWRNCEPCGTGWKVEDETT